MCALTQNISVLNRRNIQLVCVASGVQRMDGAPPKRHTDPLMCY